MKPLNLREFAKSLMLGEHRDYAIEILENLDFVENSNFDELCREIAHCSEKEFKDHEPLKQIDHISDRLDQLDEIQDILNQHKFDGDPSDDVRQLAEAHMTIQGLLQDKGYEGDLIECVLQLLDRVPQYDL